MLFPMHFSSFWAKNHRRSVIEANEAVAYPVFAHAVELWGKLRQQFDLTNILPTQFWTSRTFCLPSFERHATPMLRTHVFNPLQTFLHGRYDFVCSLSFYTPTKETRIGDLPILKKIMFNASILFKTTTRDNIKYINHLNKPIHLFFKGGTVVSNMMVLGQWRHTWAPGDYYNWEGTLVKLKGHNTNLGGHQWSKLKILH